METEKLAERAAALGGRMLDDLAAISSPLVRGVRGLGLMVAVELKKPAGSFLAALAERGVLALNAGSTVMRFLPPLTISAEDVDTVVARVAEVLAEA
jgi:acetylornithine/LysW-gamma-L-lysine aminotransferase